MSFAETHKTFQDFMEEYEGASVCACDHGCNQWLKRSENRIILGLRMLKSGSKNLDKLASMKIHRVNKIWHRIYKNENHGMNVKLRKSDLYESFLACQIIGLDCVNTAIRNCMGDISQVTDITGLKSYVINDYIRYTGKSQLQQIECMEAYHYFNRKIGR